MVKAICQGSFGQGWQGLQELMRRKRMGRSWGVRCGSKCGKTKTSAGQACLTGCERETASGAWTIRACHIEEGEWMLLVNALHGVRPVPDAVQ